MSVFHRHNHLQIRYSSNNSPLAFFPIMPMISVIKLLANVGVRTEILRFIYSVVFLRREHIGKLLVIQRFAFEDSEPSLPPW